jgi:hypothetical protein
MSQPQKGTYFISSYEFNLKEAEQQIEDSLKTFDAGYKLQIWKIKQTKECMNYIIAAVSTTGKKLKETEKEVFLELLKEVETTGVEDRCE